MLPRAARYRGRVSSARDLLAALLLLIALVLGAAWLPAVWLQRNVIAQDGFLAIAQPLADDRAAQQEISEAAVASVLDDDRIPGWISERLTPLLEEQAAKITQTDAYGTVWDRTMVSLHESLFVPGAEELQVDLLPLVDRMLSGAEEFLPVELPRPDSASVTVATIPDIPLLTRAAALAPYAPWLGLAAGALVLLALLLAAHRRAILGLAGLAGILAGGVVCLLAARIQTLVPDLLDQAAFLGPIVRAFEEHFAADLMPQGVVMLGAGALVAAVGLVLVGLSRQP